MNYETQIKCLYGNILQLLLFFIRTLKSIFALLKNIEFGFGLNISQEMMDIFVFHFKLR